MKRILSVIIPVKNGASTIGRLLDRLADLPCPAGWQIEVVVGYQDSTDDTLEILRSRPARIAYCAGTGPSANRNAAVAESRGELLYFIDADACPSGKNFLEKLLDGAHRYDKLGAMGGPILIDPAQRNHPIALGDHYACWFCWHPHQPSGESFFQPSAHLLIPRAVFLAAGGFDENLCVLEDFDLQCRIKQLGLRVYFDQAIAITHHARSRLLQSWRHSWNWGAPARELFYRRVETRYRFADDPVRFRRNLPGLFLRRLYCVSIAAFAHCWWRALVSYPFLVATLAAWVLAVGYGERNQSAQRKRETVSRRIRA